jgi:hypothetical protein
MESNTSTPEARIDAKIKAKDRLAFEPKHTNVLLAVANGACDLVVDLDDDQLVLWEQARHGIEICWNEFHSLFNANRYRSERERCEQCCHKLINSTRTYGIGFGSCLHKSLKHLLIRRAVVTEYQLLATGNLMATTSDM